MRAVLDITNPSSAAALRAALEGLVRLNEVFLQTRTVPRLYATGVVYRPERREDWNTIPTVMKLGCGDCEDLAAWRAAELRRDGLPARAVVRLTGPSRWHAVVDRGDGVFEDPSKALGMGAHRALVGAGQASDGIKLRFRLVREADGWRGEILYLPAGLVAAKGASKADAMSKAASLAETALKNALPPQARLALSTASEIAKNPVVRSVYRKASGALSKLARSLF